MRRFLLSCTALVAMMAAASAADLPRKALPPAPLPAPVYNWNGFYIGVEGGYAWSDRLRLNVGGFDFAATSNDLKGGFFGGTVGYNFQPLGSAWLLGIEADGGWAWADNQLSAVLVGPLATVTLSQTEFHSGWTIGGGLEYLFAPNWSGKVEYMYADFGNVSYVSNLVPGGVGLGATLHTIKGGINYHFNWDNGPVVARY